MKIQRVHIVRLLSSLITDELKRSRKQSWSGSEIGSQTVRSGDSSALEAMRISTPTRTTSATALETSGNAAHRVQSFEADSIERLMLAGRVNQFFHLHETGVEDYLLRRNALGEWADIIETALQHGTTGLSFQTSGSTGAPKRCTHSWESVWREIDELARICSQPVPVKRIIACVQPHHIYGFLFTVALPGALDCPVIDGLDMPPSGLAELLREGDCIISFPTYWQYLASSIPAFPSRVQGVTSTSPCPPSLMKQVCEQGLTRLVEVYGASETGGVGWRAAADAPFTLFSYWSLEETDTTVNSDTTVNPLVYNLSHRLPNGERYSLMDTINVVSSRQFYPEGRVDGAVQVGGVNVFPRLIEKSIESLECVAECAVRLMRPEEGTRLKAFIVLQQGWDNSPQTREYIYRWITTNLPAPEQPKALSFGVVLPRNAMGKLADWSYQIDQQIQ